MTPRLFLALPVFALAFAATPLTVDGANLRIHANQALADDSEDMNAPRENRQQYGNFPNSGGGNPGNRNACGYGNACGQGNGEQERQQSRFGKNQRESGGGREGGGREGGERD